MADVAFLICVERGALEGQAILFTESVRAWGGAFSEAPVYAFAPRPESRPAPATADRLHELGASYVEAPLNVRYDRFPTLNKVVVCAWAERELDHETLVFADSDSVFLNEPAELATGDWEIAVRPVDRKIAGSRGRGRNEPYWRRLYSTLGVTSEPFTETTVDREPIRAYWNAGLVAARREAGLFARWEEAARRLVDADVMHPKRPDFVDQFALAGVTADQHEGVRVLPPAYNYPLAFRSALPEPLQTLTLEQIAHLHYHRWFQLPGLLEMLDPPFAGDGERYRWLDSRLPLEPEIKQPFPPKPGRRGPRKPIREPAG
jgi:hypothetical protein